MHLFDYIVYCQYRDTALFEYTSERQAVSDAVKQVFFIDFYFNDSTGIFRREAGDDAVVVNFGEVPLMDPPGSEGIAHLEFDGGGSSVIHATIINTRFIGTSESQRLDSSYWVGGALIPKQIIFEPYYGLAILSHDFLTEAAGGTQSSIGTETWPALTYVTHDVENMSSNAVVIGEIICLNNWRNLGGPDVIHNPGFMGYLPGYFIDDWPADVSGTMHTLRWREVANASL